MIAFLSSTLKFLKIIFFCVAALFFLWVAQIFGVVFYENYSGYCSVSRSHLSDEMKIDAAVSHVLGYYGLSVKVIDKDNKKKRIPRENFIKYSSVAEFKKINPDCCIFTPKTLNWEEGYEVSFFDRLMGRLPDMVLVSYLARYKDDEGNIVNYPDRFYVYLTNCGEPWDPI